MNRKRKIALISIAATTSILGYITSKLVNMIIHPSWHHPGLGRECSPSQHEFSEQLCIDQPETAIKEKFETVRIKYNDNNFVEGWFFPSLKSRSTRLVIFVHGAGADRRNGYKLVPFLIKAGFSVFLYDSPNHGKSSNNNQGVSYGIRESRAFPSVVDWALTKAKQLYVISTSAGSSTVVLSKEKWKGKIKAVAFENPFLSLKELVNSGVIAKYLPDFYLNIIFWLVSRKGGFDPDKASPALYLADFPDIPVVVMHGTADAMIPFSHGKLFFEKLNVTNKQFFQADNTRHCRVWDDYPEKFESLVLSLFNRRTS